MTTYTFITDYQGGTYISQQAADNLRVACDMWKAHVLNGQYIPDLDTKQFIRSFDADIEELPPVPLDELSNVWLFQLMIEDDMLTVHIVQTDLSVTDVAAESQASRATV